VVAGAVAVAAPGGERRAGMLRGGSGNCEGWIGRLVSGSWKMRTMVSVERRERVRWLDERLGVVSGCGRCGGRWRRRYPIQISRTMVRMIARPKAETRVAMSTTLRCFGV